MSHFCFAFITKLLIAQQNEKKMKQMLFQVIVIKIFIISGCGVSPKK